MKKHALWITAIIAMVFLVAAAGIRNTRLGAQLRFSGKIHEPKVDINFLKIGKFIPSEDASIEEFYFGLPHPWGAEEEFEDELWNIENQSICGYRFYSKPGEPTPKIRAEVSRIFTSEANFEAYSGWKLCGGYHADFAVKFRDDSGEYWFLVCMGCSEVIGYTKNRKLFFELDDDSYYAFRELWKATYLAEQGAAPQI